MGLLRFYFSILKNFGFIIRGRKLSKIGSLGSLLVFLDSSGALTYLRKPRTLEEIAKFLRDIKRTDILLDLMEVLRCEGVLRKMSDGFVLDRNRLEKVKKQFEKIRLLKDGSRGVRKAFRNALGEVAVNILRGKSYSFSDASIGMTFLYQTQSEAYDFGRKLLLELGDARKFRGKVVLDLGCGYGVEPATLYKFFNGQCKLILADFFEDVLSRCMLYEFEYGGKKVCLKDLPNLEFKLFDPEFRKPFDLPDESVDLVFSFQLLHWTKYVPEIVSESFRALRRKGKFLVATPLKKGEEVHATDVLIKLVGGYKMWSTEEISKILKDAGFRKVKIWYDNFIVAEKQ